MRRARKSLGQNFLVDPNIQRRIVAALEAAPDDEVLEIGPGTGALTRHLAGHVRRLVLIEKDRELAAALRSEFEGRDDIVVNEADVLRVRLDDLFDKPAALRVIGNIPYNITTPILFHLLTRAWRPAHIVLMVQKEVADRITAGAGEEAYGALSIGVQAVAAVERLFHVGRHAFRPAPNVDSTVLRITPLRPCPLSEREEMDLRRLTQVAFGWRRKQLQRTLRYAPMYTLALDQLARVSEKTGIDFQRRPETLDPSQMISLARALRETGVPRDLP